MVLASNAAHNLLIAFLQDFWLSTGHAVPQRNAGFARQNSRGTHCPGASSAGPQHSTETAGHVLSPINMYIAMEMFSMKAWETHWRRASIVVKTHNLNTSSSLFNINAGQAIRASAKDCYVWTVSYMWKCLDMCCVSIFEYNFFIQIALQHANLYKSEYQNYSYKFLNVFKKTWFQSWPFVIKIYVVFLVKMLLH